MHDVAGHDVFGNSNSRLAINRKPFRWFVRLAFGADQSHVDSLLCKEGMNQVFHLLRIEVVAIQNGKNAHGGFQVGGIIFGSLNPFFHTLSGESVFDEYA